MFRNIFSFEGRIRRTEFGISYIIYFISYFFILVMIEGANPVKLFFFLFFPLIWFILAQSAKRCHDLDKSGWWQIIPFYVFWMLFENGTEGPNEYGENPKDLNNIDPLLYRDDIYNGGEYAYVPPIVVDNFIPDNSYSGDNNFISDNNGISDNNFDEDNSSTSDDGDDDNF